MLAGFPEVLGFDRSIGLGMGIDGKTVGKGGHLPAGRPVALPNPRPEVIGRPKMRYEKEFLDAEELQKTHGVLVPVVIVEERARRFAAVLPDEVEIGACHGKEGKKNRKSRREAGVNSRTAAAQ